MSRATELLENLTEEEINIRLADYETEGHIVISEDRFITVPDRLKRVAVQFDKDIETVMFDCPRYWDGIDLSKMIIYVNYMRPDHTRGMYHVGEVTVDEVDPNIMHFEWVISSNVTEIKGKISFLVCAKTVDENGNEELHWNSELNQEMYISEGLECVPTVVSEYPDIITDLLTRMRYTETIATPEHMQEYIDDFFTSEKGADELRTMIYDYLVKTDPTSAEYIKQYVVDYLTEHPARFVIGPKEPGISCIWFNTAISGDEEENDSINLTPDGDKGIYAEVEGVKHDYDYNLI